MRQHNIFIGDKVEEAIRVIGEEANETDEYELVDQYGTGDLDVETELRGNYLLVRVEE